jgi:hypothetical protein
MAVANTLAYYYEALKCSIIQATGVNSGGIQTLNLRISDTNYVNYVTKQAYYKSCLSLQVSLIFYQCIRSEVECHIKYATAACPVTERRYICFNLSQCSDTSVVCTIKLSCNIK